LNSGDPGYTGSFKHNIQQIINAINAAGKTALLAKAPPVLPVDGPSDSIIQQYNMVMDELAGMPANGIPVPPADFHTYFRSHTAEFANSLDLNGVGHQSLAQIWLQTLSSLPLP
jgi:hypothetical protein